METLDLEKLFPDLFEGMTQEQIDDINDSWAYQWHEGWEPNRRDVYESLQVQLGKLTPDEFRKMVIARATSDQRNLQRA